MKKLHISAMAILLSAAVLLGGCAEQHGVQGSLPNEENSTSSVLDSDNSEAVNSAGESNVDSENSSEPDDKYLSGLKDKYNIKSGMGYFSDYFDLAQYELPEFINDKYAYYHDHGVIDKTRIVAELYNDDNRDLNEFGIYDFTTGSYETVYSPFGSRATMTILEFVNSDYLVFTEYEEDPVKGKDHVSISLYIIDLASEDRTPELICTETEGFCLQFSIFPALLDGKLYFNAYNDVHWTAMTSIYCYNIETKQLEKVVEEGLEPSVYKGKIVYYASSPRGGYIDEDAVGSLDGTIDLRGAGRYWICESDIFSLDVRLSGPKSLASGKTLMSGGRQFMESGCGKYISFYDFPVGAEKREDFIYDIANDMILVFKDSDKVARCDNWLKDGTGTSLFWHYSEFNGIEVAFQINVFTEK